jgi:hypothetical protein
MTRLAPRSFSRKSPKRLVLRIPTGRGNLKPQLSGHWPFTPSTLVPAAYSAALGSIVRPPARPHGYFQRSLFLLGANRRALPVPGSTTTRSLRHLVGNNHPTPGLQTNSPPAVCQRRFENRINWPRKGAAKGPPVGFSREDRGGAILLLKIIASG